MDKELLTNEQLQNNEETQNHNHGNITPTDLTKELKDSFLSYAMSVIVDRALPDVRDGLKPVHRRILYAMNDLGIYANSQYKKSARIVGEVIGKYHPHGDTSVYDAMVRMAQSFAINETLVDGHGNFGSVDGDGAAAMRYTEARMSKIAMEMVRDLDKDTVDFIDNYDATEKEPKVLPSRFPNLLVNGSTGIAVGLATKIPPHNLGEVIDGTIKLILEPNTTLYDLMKIIKAPDFPTGGQILDLANLTRAYQTGRGSITIRAKSNIYNHGLKPIIEIVEIPYEVSKAMIIEKIAQLVKDKVLDGITDIRDESSRKGMKLIIELRKDVNAEVMLNTLYKYTQLQSTYSINTIALVEGKPEQLSLIEILKYYIEFQIEVINRRTIFELKKAEARAHILKGLIKVLNDIDRAIQLIKESKNVDEAKEKLMNEYGLDDIQARAILDMKLQRLTSFEIQKIKNELEELLSKIKEYQLIIGSRSKKEEILVKELSELKKYASPRKSELSLTQNLSIDNEDLIEERDVIVTITKNGYIKRIDASQYKAQKRGGVGITNIKTHEDDYVLHMLNSSTHQDILLLTNLGRVYKIRCHQIQEASRQSKGIPLVNLIEFMPDEHIQVLTAVNSYDDDKYLCFLTKFGYIKKTSLKEFESVKQNGKIAISLEDGDELLDVKPISKGNHIILASYKGQGLKFDSNDLGSYGRTARGNMTMKLDQDDQIIGFAVINSDEDHVLVISENGYGKKTPALNYRLFASKRGRGVKILNCNEKIGKLASIKVVDDTKDLIVSTTQGIVIRTHIKDIPTLSRTAGGVSIIRLKEGQKVATITLDDMETNDDNLDNISINENYDLNKEPINELENKE